MFSFRIGFKSGRLTGYRQVLPNTVIGICKIPYTGPPLVNTPCMEKDELLTYKVD